MSREEAAAKAVGARTKGQFDCYPFRTVDSMVNVVLAAADAHDRANGIHRIALDDATVERAARALFIEDNPEAVWDRFEDTSFIKERYRVRTKAVLAAAVKEEQA